MPGRCATPACPVNDSSGDESRLGRHTTDGYTSGAFNSVEDPCQLGSISGTDGPREFDPQSEPPERLLETAFKPAELRLPHLLLEAGIAVLTTSHCQNLGAPGKQLPLQLVHHGREGDYSASPESI